MGVFETVQYHLFPLWRVWQQPAGDNIRAEAFWIPASLFATGIVLFAGSLYLLGMTGLSWLGAITPIGGLGFLGGGQASLGSVCLQTCDRMSRYNDNSDFRKRQKGR